MNLNVSSANLTIKVKPAIVRVINYYKVMITQGQEKASAAINFSSVVVKMGHLHVMFNALHDDDMQWPVLVCMLLNECLPLSLFACPCFQKTTMLKVGILIISFYS